MPKVTRFTLIGYGVAVLSVGGVLAIRVLLSRYVDTGAPFLLFLLAIMVSA